MAKAKNQEHITTGNRGSHGEKQNLTLAENAKTAKQKRKGFLLLLIFIILLIHSFKVDTPEHE